MGTPLFCQSAKLPARQTARPAIFHSFWHKNWRYKHCMEFGSAANVREKDERVVVRGVYRNGGAGASCRRRRGRVTQRALQSLMLGHMSQFYILEIDLFHCWQRFGFFSCLIVSVPTKTYSRIDFKSFVFIIMISLRNIVCYGNKVIFILQKWFY